MPPASQSLSRPSSRSLLAMARTLDRACPSSCMTLSSETPPLVHRSVGSRASAIVLPPRSKARHFTPPVLKSQPVMTADSGRQRNGSGTRFGSFSRQLDGNIVRAMAKDMIKDEETRKNGDASGPCQLPAIGRHCPRSRIIGRLITDAPEPTIAQKQPLLVGQIEGPGADPAEDADLVAALVHRTIPIQGPAHGQGTAMLGNGEGRDQMWRGPRAETVIARRFRRG